MGKYKHIYRKKSGIEGYGVYALQDIEPKQDIVQYAGEKISKARADRSASRFIFTLNKRYDILGRNIAKYINHSCEPNAEAWIIGNEVWIKSIRRIKKGEEIAYNYGYSWDDELHRCLCQSKQCVGYILAKEHWSKVKNKNKI